MRKGLRIAGLLFVFAALACAAPAVAEDAPKETAAPEEYAVVVGDVRFSKELVQFSLTNLIDSFAANGETITEADVLALRDETIDHFVQLGVIDNRLKEEGRDGFSEEDLAYYRTYAQQTYESVWQGLYKQMLPEYGDSLTEETVSEWLNGIGYTVDMFYDDALASSRLSRAVRYYCGDVTITTPEIAEFYMKNFVEPDREKYENDIPRYENEVLSRGSDAFFVPEGYRYIKHILLPFPDELQAEIDDVTQRIQQGGERRQEAYDALAEAAAGGEDIAPYKAAYDETCEAVDALGEEYLATLQKAVPMLKDKTDEIYRRYKAGESFETLMTEFSADSMHQKEDDEGYLFHPQSENWAEVFRLAAAALSSPGDISQPVVTASGVHIIRYMADAPGGVHKLTAQEQEALNASALQEKRLLALENLIEGWKADYAIETHPEMLDTSVPPYLEAASEG